MINPGPQAGWPAKFSLIFALCLLLASTLGNASPSTFTGKVIDIADGDTITRSGSANLHKPLSGKSATKKALKWA